MPSQVISISHVMMTPLVTSPRAVFLCIRRDADGQFSLLMSNLKAFVLIIRRRIRTSCSYISYHTIIKSMRFLAPNSGCLSLIQRMKIKRLSSQAAAYLPSRPNFINCLHNVLIFPFRRMMSWYQKYLFMYFLSGCSCHANRKRKESAFTSAIFIKSTVGIVYIRAAHSNTQRRPYFWHNGKWFYKNEK